MYQLYTHRQSCILVVSQRSTVTLGYTQGSPISVIPTKYKVNPREDRCIPRAIKPSVRSKIARDRKSRRDAFQIIHDEIIQRTVRDSVCCRKRSINRHGRQHACRDIVRARV